MGDNKPVPAPEVRVKVKELLANSPAFTPLPEPPPNPKSGQKAKITRKGKKRG
jgi:hypothetical protein